MNLQGIVCFYSFETGEYLHSKYVSLTGALKDAIITMDQEAKSAEKMYKQIFIMDKDAQKNIFYKANFK